MDFQYTHTQIDRFPVISLSGRLLSREAANTLLETVDKYLPDHPDLIIDLSSLEYMNSTGLGILVNILTKARNAGGELLIVRIPPSIHQLLIMTKILSIFRVAKSPDEAIKWLKTSKKLTENRKEA